VRRLLYAVRGLAGLALLALPVAAQAPLPCGPSEPEKLTNAQAGLLLRAGKDPVIGCTALLGTYRTGDQTVARTDTIRGNLIVLDGTLRVAGMVQGNVLVFNGAAIIDTTGHVTGDVTAAEHGATIVPDGRIDGELRTLDAVQPVLSAAAPSALGGTFLSLTHTAAWFGIVILLAVGVLTNAGDAMQRVTGALNASFGRNFVVGLGAQLALLPILVAICLMLALTLLGLLLVPFAIVAYVIAVLGLVVLGGVGAVQTLGAGLLPRRPGATERAARLQSMVVGLVVLSLPWLIAAALATWPVPATIVRTLALGVTWVAITAGLGAALRTRGGTRSHEERWGIRRPAPSGTPLPVEPPQAEWLTPTPITGVVAVKRHAATSGRGR
jgi:hypothetical protein